VGSRSSISREIVQLLPKKYCSELLPPVIACSCHLPIPEQPNILSLVRSLCSAGTLNDSRASVSLPFVATVFFLSAAECRLIFLYLCN